MSELNKFNIFEYCKPQAVGDFIDLGLCDDIIVYFEDPNTKKIKSSGKYDDKTNVSIYDPLIRDGEEAVLNKNTSLTDKYINELIRVLSIYKQNFPEVNDLLSPWNINEVIKIQKTSPPDQAFHEIHVEASNIDNCKRLLVFMTYLNDVTDGGETEFINQNVKIKPQKGLTLIWPAHFGYPHRGLTSPTQEKYIVTGWFSFVKS